MTRDYQYDYSEIMPSVYDVAARERKAVTTLAVLEDFFGESLAHKASWATRCQCRASSSKP